jgi:Transposase, Mutator family
MLTVVPDDCPDQPGASGGSSSLIDEIVREGARRMLAEQRAFAQREAFEGAYGVKFPKAAKISDGLDQLLAFYDYRCEHWVHLRTTNPIESAFATVRHRTKVTKGPGSRGPAMAFKLIRAARDRWRAVNAPHLVVLVRAGAHFVRGVLVERPETTAA